MKQMALIIVALVLFLSHGLAAEPIQFNKMIDADIGMVEHELVALAEAMPGDNS